MQTARAPGLALGVLALAAALWWWKSTPREVAVLEPAPSDMPDGVHKGATSSSSSARETGGASSAPAGTTLDRSPEAHEFRRFDVSVTRGEAAGLVLELAGLPRVASLDELGY